MSFGSLMNKLNTLRGENSVTPFAYTSEAYDKDDADGHADFDAERPNNIPLATNSVVKLSTLVANKGLRDQASSIPRMFINHFCGRVSYNLNKTVDVLYEFLYLLTYRTFGVPEGLAPLDTNGRIPSEFITEDLVEYKGGWDASTNTPNLNTVAKTKGDMYLVSVGGTQELVDGEGVTRYNVGDEVIFNGTNWQKIASGEVDTVNGKAPDSTGNVSLNGKEIEYEESTITDTLAYIKARAGLTYI